MAYKVYLDAGHGGWDNGASYQGRLEKDDTLNLALAVGNILKNNGIDVGYTRTTDIYQSPFQKSQIANQAGADMFVSIHRNSSPNPNTYSGAQVLIYNQGGIKEVAANNILDELSKIGFNNLGVSIRPNLVVLKRTNMPSLLVEAGFINTDADNVIFDSRFNDMANAIATGILETIAVPKVYRVQVALYQDYARAEELRNKLADQGYTAVVVPFKNLFAVRVGEFNTLEDAVRFERELQQIGYETLVVESR